MRLTLSTMNKMIFKIPDKLTAPNIRHFLTVSEPLFQMTDKMVPNVVFEIDKSQKVDLIGLILIYKFMEFSIRKNCFMQPKCDLPSNSVVYKEIERYGFRDIIFNFMRNKPADYDKLKPKTYSDELIIAPIFLQQNSNVDEVSQNCSEVCKYYGNNLDILEPVLTALGEIASNFRSHAVSDTESIIAAKGTKTNFEIACADTGDGIITTLSKSSSNKHFCKQKFDILLNSLSRGVSSKDKKKTNHMGSGLWLVNELVTAGKGSLYIFSEGAYVMNLAGSIRKGLCSYWKGTIVYINLPLYHLDKYKNVFNNI